MSRKVGLSEFTSQRLAELKARRAEAEMSDNNTSHVLIASSTAPSDGPNLPATSSVSVEAPVIAPKPNLASLNKDVYRSAVPIQRKENNVVAAGNEHVDKTLPPLAHAGPVVERVQSPMVATKMKASADSDKYNTEEVEYILFMSFMIIKN
ncbi:hypothetical protein HELRODRAFT_163868 [Helobdella robusta]|uniref:Uncharacterized protein n=1 Tax=Helobdella robusta TaxID=6412 RepID=T1EUK2_HELRO|nr:hypothetical protein HELRODRAFT_163868 [Helobdella robusta]ESN96757.1 hypothetical protein HELRODRAFT_163868 [Helobdella robusta]